jgi:transcriptional regulator GlxA family with amidase domain
MSTGKTLGILIFDEVEVLDFCGPFEVFSVANRLMEKPALQVMIVAEKSRPIGARGGLSVNPHCRINDCPPLDILLIPGGQGARTEMHNGVVLDWVKEKAAKAELLLSVCTGSLILAKAGLLDGKEATTHHAAIDLLKENAPKTTVHGGCIFVESGNIISSAGISSGIDMSLHVVAKLYGNDLARKTADQMEFPWEPAGE